MLKKHILIVINIKKKTIVLLNNFCGNHDNFFSQFFDEYDEFFHNIINVFIVTLDQFNTSLLNKSIYLKVKKKNLAIP